MQHAPSSASPFASYDYFDCRALKNWGDARLLWEHFLDSLYIFREERFGGPPRPAQDIKAWWDLRRYIQIDFMDESAMMDYCGVLTIILLSLGPEFGVVGFGAWVKGLVLGIVAMLEPGLLDALWVFLVYIIQRV